MHTGQPDAGHDKWVIPETEGARCEHITRRSCKKGDPAGPPFSCLQGADHSPASARSAAALSVVSQVKSTSSRPKWP